VDLARNPFCITKMMDKFQFKFSAILCLCTEVIVGVRESLMFLVNSHILKMAAMLKSSVEYNPHVEGRPLFERSVLVEIIRFFGYSRSTIYVSFHCDKMTALEQSNEGSSTLTRKNYSKERTAKISIDCWYKRANNMSNCRGGSSIQIVHIKDTTDVLWSYQDKPSCSPQLPF